MTDCSRRHLLRARTREAHRQVDEAVGGFNSRDAYLRYLNGQYAFRRAIEAALAISVWPRCLGDWRPVTLSALLAADRADLGLAGRCRPERVTLEPEEVLGVVYVLQGASLGARLLQRRAREMGFDARRGARHLAYQAGDHDGWNRFLAFLDAAEPFDAERTVNAALATFAIAGRAFEGARHAAV